MVELKSLLYLRQSTDEWTTGLTELLQKYNSRVLLACSISSLSNPTAEPCRSLRIDLGRGTRGRTGLRSIALDLINHALHGQIVRLNREKIVSSTLILGVLLEVLAHLYDLFDERGLLERRALLYQWNQDFFDELEPVGPLVVVSRVVLIHATAERQLLLEHILHEI